MATDPRMEAFCAAAPDEVAAAARMDPAFADRLREVVERARAEHEGVAVDDAGFVSHLAARIASVADPRRALDELACGDLYLVHACLQGDAVALESFAAEHWADIERSASKVRSTGLLPQEFAALVHEQLFVQPRKAAQYAGRGDVRGWLRVVLSRLVVDLQRRAAVRPEQRPTAPDDLLQLAEAGDPELRFLQEKYREPVRVSLERAFAGLTPRERNLLRLRVLEGFNHDQIGARYGIHRTSAARWLGEAQRALLTGTRTRLREDFGIGEDEFASVAALVQSRLHLSLHRILSSTLESETDEK